MCIDPFTELGDLAGILPAYYDIWGNRHETSEKTRAALLGAMGQAAGDADAAAAAVREWRCAAWTSPLPVVQVETAGAAFRVTVRLPEATLGLTHGWRILLEGGGQLEGRFAPTALEHLGSFTLANGDVREALALDLPAIDAIGYHLLECRAEGGEAQAMRLIVCPRTCHMPAALRDGGRLWGLAVQLHSLRSGGNWGAGDYADLGSAIDWAGRAGAGLVGINPVHALFPHNPRHCSPYSPSSRQYLNTLPLNVEAVPEFAECAEARELVAHPQFQARLAALREARLVDYAGVAAAKVTVLERIYRHFRDHHLAAATPRALAFREFQGKGGDELARFALYDALQEHFFRQDPACWGWPAWPEAYRDPTGAKVRRFAETHAERVEWFQWLQWLADQQLAAAAARARDRGMAIGLYQDLAVGVDRGSAETWAHRELYALEARVGCPPDDFNLMGQDWGLPPWIPHKLTAAAYAPYIAMLRANMKHAGALRIDHVMGLMRLYWVPPAMQGNEGAYLAYPFRDLLGILALESQRNQCLIVGEDLGTVPDEVRGALLESGVLSYRLFYFERQQDGNFMPPSWYPEQALVAASTHDLPTLTGFWQGRDIEVRSALELYPTEQQRAAQIAGRITERAQLLTALAREGLLPADLPLDPQAVPELTPDLLRAVHRYLARTPAKLLLVQAEDLLGETEQANMPGTVDGHPNWRRKLSLAIEAWDGDVRLAGMAEALKSERPSLP